MLDLLELEEANLRQVQVQGSACKELLVLLWCVERVANFPVDRGNVEN